MNRLNERISKAEVLFFVKELHHNEEGIAQFCNVLLKSEQEQAAYNAAWILSHLSKEDKEIYLMPFYDKIVDMAISPCLKIRRGLILSILADLPINTNFRTDLLNFCLNNMSNSKESDSSRSVMIKLAAKMCKPFPELKNELTACLEYLSEEVKPSISAASKNALKDLRKVF